MCALTSGSPVKGGAVQHHTTEPLIRCVPLVNSALYLSGLRRAQCCRVKRTRAKGGEGRRGGEWKTQEKSVKSEAAVCVRTSKSLRPHEGPRLCALSFCVTFLGCMCAKKKIEPGNNAALSRDENLVP